jgi:subtilase family serine protease
LIDVDNAVTEVSENNAYGPVVVSVGQADLVVESMTSSDLNPAVGQPVTITFTLLNQGSAAAPAFDAAFFKNRPTAPAVGAQPTETLHVDGLAPGERKTLSVTTTHAAADFTQRRSWIFADSAGVVEEADETNNTKDIVPTIRQADLVITAVHAPAQTSPGTAVSVTVTIKNQGTADAGAFAVGLYNNRPTAPDVQAAPTLTRAVSSLAAGQSLTLTFSTSYGVSTLATRSTWAFIDQSDQVDESLETNNAFGPVAVRVQQ